MEAGRSPLPSRPFWKRAKHIKATLGYEQKREQRVGWGCGILDSIFPSSLCASFGGEGGDDMVLLQSHTHTN